MSGLEEKVWSYEPEKWVDILLNWVEFLRQTGNPSTTTLRNIVVRLPLTSVSDEYVQKVRQLVELLLQRVPTRCSVEAIQSFGLVFVKKFDTRVGPPRHSYVSAEFDSIVQHFCRFCENLPLNITKFRFNTSGLRSEAREVTDPIFSALSQNRHLTELKTNFLSPLLWDQLIPRNPLLETLHLTGLYSLDNKAASSLMRAFFNGKTSKLKTFICQSSGWTGQHGVTELDIEATAMLKSNTHLQQLSLEYNRFGDAGACLIAEALSVNKSLRHLDISGCRVGDRGCMALCQALQVNNTLESLDFRHNTFGDECAHSFVSALRINRTLRTLGTENSFLAGMLLKSDTQLQHLHGLTSDDAEASFIAEGLKVNKSLNCLDISFGRIGDQGCIALAQALQVNNTLEKLILDENQIGEAGIEALASALKINHTLQQLSLNNNCLVGDAGASFMAKALAGNNSLKRLEMFCCNVGDQGCKAIAQALQVNNMLERLVLDSIKCSDAGVRAFIPTLRSNRPLQHLDMRGKELPAKETVEELLQVVCHFLLPVWVNIKGLNKAELEGPPANPTAALLVRLDCASHFNCDFHKKCRELRDGTISDGHPSFQWFQPFLGSTHPFVKKTVLFLLLRQRAEVAAKSLLQKPTPCCCKRERNRVETTDVSN